MWAIEADLSEQVSRAHIGGKLSGTNVMQNCAPQGCLIGQLLVLLFVNDLEALTLLFADGVKKITLRAQNMNLHISLIAAWDWSQKWDLTVNPAKAP